ncbi:DUF58 domain-containing protein [Brevibacterium yomogidense]|uniref:DUF58 domain-containing protein n=1 Tax=Brevibacterium yomogidense TaxID=946573 RepID=UPI0018DFF7DD|nr:DUF58 domain-containing protein [Brevibacterium yomogidense]
MTALLTRIRARLTLHTHRRVASLLDGGWASVFHGQSLDFDDLREYVDGDEVRDIDWKASARHSVPLVKRYTDHRRLRLALVVATGRSMDAMSAGGEVKRDLAILLAGMAGWFAVRGGDEVCLVASDGHRTRLGRPESSEAGLEHILRRILAHRGTDDRSTVLDHLEWLSSRLRRRHLVIVVSDEIDLTDAHLRLLRKVSSHHEVLWLTVLEADPLALAATEDIPFDIGATLAGAAAGTVKAGATVPRLLAADPSVSRAYREAEEARRHDSARVLRSAGIVEERVGASAQALPAFHRAAERHRRAR